MASAGATAAAYAKEVCDTLTKAVVEIVNSSNFDKEEILQRKLNLTQAYSLLMQDSKNGKVNGAMELLGGAVCAAIVDLIVLDRIEIEIDHKSLLGIKYVNTLLKVKNEHLTGTILDEALFLRILEHHEKSLEKPKEVQDYIKRDIWKFSSDTCTAFITLGNLVEQGILEQKKTLFGKKYPTLNPEPQAALVKEIRKVALENSPPDAYIRALMLIMRAVDNFHILSDPLLRRHFSKEEYKPAKERIKGLVGLGKKTSNK